MKIILNSIYIYLLAQLASCGAISEDQRSARSKTPHQPGSIESQIGAEQILKPSIFDSDYQLYPFDASKSETFAKRFPIDRDSSVSFLKPGAEFFNARMQLLANAKKSVRIQYLLFHGDESGWRIAEKLVELKKRGLDVHIIIDNLSNYSYADQRLYYYLRSNDIIIEGWEFLFLDVIGSVAEMNEFGIAVDDFNRRYHEKMFIVDGENPDQGMAILGGANIGNNYFRIEHDNPDRMWHDSEVIVKGPIVEKITQVYDENLAHFRSKRVFSGSSSLLWMAIKTLFPEPKVPRNLNDNYMATLKAIEKQNLNISWNNVPMRFIQSRPREREDYVYPVFLDLINNAQKEILINHSYFVPDEEFIAALQNAARRGVKVHVMTNTVETIDFPHVVIVGRTLYKEILAINETTSEQRVFVYEWGGEQFLENGEGQNHSKYMVVDRDKVIVGSYNIDPRSRWLNSESVLVYQGEKAAQPFVSQYLEWTKPNWTLPVSYEMSLTYDDPDNLKDAFDLIVGNIIKPYL